uniref:Chromosome 5 open reading frame 58 n=1 Tax=Catagonus wagneri TaxID=51154 RepID=A0A8C3VUA0_9CETA
MFKNNVTDHKLSAEAIIKNINTISLELKKMKELSQLLLCDLTLHFSLPVKTDDLKETERNKPLFEESKMSDITIASNSFI